MANVAGVFLFLDVVFNLFEVPIAAGVMCDFGTPATREYFREGRDLISNKKYYP